MRKKRRRLRKWVVYTLQTLATAVVVVAFTALAPFKIAVVSGQSMEKTLHDKEVLFFLKTSNIKNNDVAIFKSPVSWGLKGEWLIKRVIGKPGDRLKINGNKLYVNDTLCDIFTKWNKAGDLDITLDGYFVMGDNRGHSYDSLARLLDGQKDYLIKDIYYGKEIENKNDK